MYVIWIIQFKGCKINLEKHWIPWKCIIFEYFFANWNCHLENRIRWVIKLWFFRFWLQLHNPLIHHFFHMVKSFSVQLVKYPCIEFSHLVNITRWTREENGESQQTIWTNCILNSVVKGKVFKNYFWKFIIFHVSLITFQITNIRDSFDFSRFSIFIIHI